MVFGIVERIIRDQMMLHIVDGDCHGLFEQTVLFKLVGIHQGANQTSVAILISVLLQLDAR